MNIFTERSIELASQKDYLDQLFTIYPLSPDNIREIQKDVWKEIKNLYNKNDNEALLKALLKLKLFPVKDSYVPFFRRDPSAISRNPKTVNRICGRVRELGLDNIYKRISEPKETNRQIGPLFKRWIDSGVLGLTPVSENDFLKNDNDAILSGSDTELKNFAKEHLNFERNNDKGFDFIGRFNKNYIIGEAKFITDEGGHQNDQFLDAVSILDQKGRNDIITVAILDGVLYIKSKKKMYKAISEHNQNIMSALMLRDFLYSLECKK